MSLSRTQLLWQVKGSLPSRPTHSVSSSARPPRTASAIRPAESTWTASSPIADVTECLYPFRFVLGGADPDHDLATRSGPDHHEVVRPDVGFDIAVDIDPPCFSDHHVELDLGEREHQRHH